MKLLNLALIFTLITESGLGQETAPQNQRLESQFAAYNSSHSIRDLFNKNLIYFSKDDIEYFDSLVEKYGLSKLFPAKIEKNKIIIVEDNFTYEFDYSEVKNGLLKVNDTPIDLTNEKTFKELTNAIAKLLLKSNKGQWSELFLPRANANPAIAGGYLLLGLTPGIAALVVAAAVVGAILYISLKNNSPSELVKDFLKKCNKLQIKMHSDLEKPNWTKFSQGDYDAVANLSFDKDEFCKPSKNSENIRAFNEALPGIIPKAITKYSATESEECKNAEKLKSCLNDIKSRMKYKSFNQKPPVAAPANGPR